MKLESVIGLEIHVQLKTKSKMFCDSPNGVEAPPNSAICPICMGHPGTLPVPNKQAIEYAVMAALALNCTIAEETHFDRKHYFYPDLPKGYQISQYKNPLALAGRLEIRDSKLGNRVIGITRVHVEEDAGKLIHAVDGSNALVDYNRAGTPLIEIVTEPDLRSPEEAKTFLEELKRIMRTIGVSDADMEKGQLRCDANVSLRPKADNADGADGTELKLYPKTEVKNMNSFKAVERALMYEIQRQTKLWEAGTPPTVLETRGWNDATQMTEKQRTKEEAHDYRYFPEPDIPPLCFAQETVDALRRKLPELPQIKRKRFIDQYDMDPGHAMIITEDKTLADWTEHVLTELRAWLVSIEGAETEEERWQNGKKKIVKLTTGWIISKLFALQNANNATWNDLKITPENFAEFVSLLSINKINSTVGQEVLAAMYATGVDPSDYIDEKKLSQVDDTETIAAAADDAIAANEKVVADYRGGKMTALKFLVGQVMRSMGGKANPTLIEKILKQLLNK